VRIPGSVGARAPAKPEQRQKGLYMDSQMRFRVNSPKIVHETIDDEVVMIDFDTGNYYSLDKVGAEIWGHIARGASVGQIARALAECYGTPDGVMGEAVHGLVAELQAENLIIEDRAGRPQTQSGSGLPAQLTAETALSPFEPPVLHKYTDMQELLLLDPIHEVDESGWPSVRRDSFGAGQPVEPSAG
jgi:hypothetical protein